jgi:hypothetical protein
MLARKLEELERKLDSDIFRDGAADDYTGPAYKTEGNVIGPDFVNRDRVAREIERQVHDIDGSGYDKITYIRGDAVDGEGHIGWADYASGKIVMPMFESVAEGYKWARDLLHKVVYKHELWEQFYKGKKDHTEMEVENVKHTDDYELHLAEAATIDIGREQGSKEAKEIAYKSGIAKLIEKYNIDRKYIKIKEGIARVLGIDGYKATVHAEVG